MFTTRRSLILKPLVVFLLFLQGCTGFGSTYMARDRFDYNKAIGDSLKEQTLVNIVKMRYMDWPVFLDVDQIVTAYTLEQVGASKALISTPFQGASDQAELGYTAKYSERPTILFKPLGGRDFVKKIMTPISPAALFALIQSGWPAGLMFRVAVQSVNGIRNNDLRIDTGEEEAADFLALAKMFRALQKKNALIMDIKQSEGNAFAVVGFRDRFLDPDTRQDLDFIKGKLGLDPALDRYNVKWDVLSRDTSILAIQTRSILQIMSAMARDIAVPFEDISEGRVVKANYEAVISSDKFKPLVNIRSGDVAPEDAFVSAEYRGKFFWIDDQDLASKRTFLLLIFMLSVAEPSESQGAPLVITTN